jgi:hypothetical protein
VLACAASPLQSRANCENRRYSSCTSPNGTKLRKSQKSSQVHFLLIYSVECTLPSETSLPVLKQLNSTCIQGFPPATLSMLNQPQPPQGTSSRPCGPKLRVLNSAGSLPRVSVGQEILAPSAGLEQPSENVVPIPYAKDVCGTSKFSASTSYCSDNSGGIAEKSKSAKRTAANGYGTASRNVGAPHAGLNVHFL